MGKINLSGIATQRNLPDLGWKPSPQQSAIESFVAEGEGNLIVEALAGTGKTSTLVLLSRRLQGGADFLAFNKAIATEIQQKLATAGVSDKEVRGATMHSVGWQAWVRHAPTARNGVRQEKLAILAEKLGIPKMYQPFAKRLCSLGKQACIGAVPDLPADDSDVWMVLVDHFDLRDLMPDDDFSLDEEEWLENGLAWTLRLLQQSIVESTHMCDFDDMIYMPLYANLRFWQKPWVLIDEAQDTNRARREIARRILTPGGRLIAVGDRNQAIYGFTGADNDALDLIQRDFSASQLPLTVTYRCAGAIVQLAQTWVPTLEARPGAPDGVARRITQAEFSKIIPEPSDAILCRNVKPLVQVAFEYLRRYIPCHIEGREIGAQLVTLIKKFKVDTVAELVGRLEVYLAQERERLIFKHQEDKAGALQDKVDTILCLADTFDPGVSPQFVIDKINQMFKDEAGLARQTITLSTVHKSKGREWGRVYLLGRSKLMPSKFAKQEWQLQQEKNLMYVAVTRAKNELIDVDLL